MIRVSATIVIYHEKPATLSKLLQCIDMLNANKEIVVVDNSKTTQLQPLVESFKKCKYFFTGKNIGFGAAHNLGLKTLQKESDIHLIVNPDIVFDAKKIDEMLQWFYHSNIALATPQVRNPDGSEQFTCREIPTLKSMLLRRLNIGGIFNNFVIQDELGRELSNSTHDIPFCHGCFMMFKTDVYKNLNGFDERFFMYMEDADIFIRAKEYGRTVINPQYSITHEHRRGSAKSLKLFWLHLVSAIKFFWKYR